MSSMNALWLRYLEGRPLNHEELAALLAALEVDTEFAEECREELRQHGAITGLLAAPSMDLIAAVGQEIQSAKGSRPRRSRRVRKPGGKSGGSGWWFPLIALGLVGGGWWWATRVHESGPKSQPIEEEVQPSQPTQRPLHLRVAFGAREHNTIPGWIPAGNIRYSSETEMGWTTDHPRRFRQRGKNNDIQQLVAFAGSSWFSDRWELDINPGAYRVTIVCGDYKDVQGPHLITVEGTPLFTGERTATGEFISKSTTITVTDGRLTLDVGGSTPLGPDQDPEIEIHLTDTALVSIEVESIE